MNTTITNPLANDVPVDLQNRMKAHAAKADAWLESLTEWVPGYIALSQEFQAAIRDHPDVHDYVDVYRGTGWDALDIVETAIFWMQDACEGGTAERWERARDKVAEIQARLQDAPNSEF